MSTVQAPRYMGPIPTDIELSKMLESVKVQVFGNTNAAFLGSLLCAHDFLWVPPDSPTYSAATNGLTIWWNKADFMRCDLTEKQATLLHELWHTGLMHGLRRGNRDPRLWNIACDYRINNNLIYDGFKLPANGWWVFDLSLDKGGILSEEQIYDLLLKNKKLDPGGSFQMDLKGITDPNVKNEILAAVVRALQAAELRGDAGKLPGNLKTVLNKFLEPKIDWKTVMHRWMTDLLDDGDFSWVRPNRRSQEIYMPSIQREEGQLEDEIMYVQDTSGSITMKDMIRFNSEVRYIKDQLQPERLHLVQFDTKIQFQKTFLRHEPFEDIEMHGGGGTSLVCVRDLIEKRRPRACVIFSDLECDPMKPLTVPTSVIWAKVRNNGIVAPFGNTFHISED